MIILPEVLQRPPHLPASFVRIGIDPRGIQNRGGETTQEIDGQFRYQASQHRSLSEFPSAKFHSQGLKRLKWRQRINPRTFLTLSVDKVDWLC